MKKKVFGLRVMLLLMLMGGPSLLAHAETYYGGSGWCVAFTDKEKMESNFRTAELDDAVSGLQPGDRVVFTLSLQNDNSVTTDWWMTNEVLRSLEDGSANSATHGGAYTYILTYTDKGGGNETLFSSETVGGDTVSGAGEGLHAATDAMEEYFYLDTLASGQSGTVTLEVALDGETQGNDYQDTLADLQMNFAVELNPDGSPRRSISRMNSGFTMKRGRNGQYEFLSLNTTPVPLAGIVQTGDGTNLLPYLLAMTGSGICILALAIYSVKRKKREREETE